MAVTATLDGDEYVINGRKYWPCNVGGWDNQGANLNLVVVPHRPQPRRHEGLSAIIVERGTPGVTYDTISTSASGPRRTSRSRSTTRAYRRRT